ncbi:MAG: hypothetical protein E7553_00935 [Ruminococcaceae bacterium]|nr:hypothetical protein [Oscillospiraceae bacterium]
MKRLWSFVFALVLMVCMITSISAQEADSFRIVSETIETFEDGFSIVTTISEENLTAENAARAGYNKTGSKTVTGKDQTGAVCWTFTVTGTFVVNEGVVSACITARYSHTISNSAWSLQSGNAAKTGNQAVASGTFIKKALGVTVQTVDTSVTLTCDKYGVLS